MNSIESPASFSHTEKADAAYRKIVSENARQGLLNRPQRSFRLLVISCLLIFFGLSSAIVFGTMILAGQFFWTPVIGLTALLAAIGAAAQLLSGRFMNRINRLVHCIEGIAKGDLSPVLPKGKYRDEFTSVNLSINQMLDELDGHCATLMESHQLTAIGTLTAGVAHEINNPLNNIMLTAHTMLEEYQDLPEAERLEMINDLIHETERAQTIVRNLQDFARESECVSEPLNLGELVEETAKLALNQAKVTGARMDIQVEPHLPFIHGDRRQWKQVFLNLILNALHAVERKGRIGIRVEKDKTPGFVTVHVEDDGHGIPAHILPYIFNPFFTTKPAGKGSGLGLSVSKGIVTRHGGWIDVSSKEGEYTRFTVTVPASPVVPEECGIRPKELPAMPPKGDFKP